MRSQLLTILFTALLTLLSVASVSYISDPDNIYSVSDEYTDKYLNLLIKSDHGLFYPEGYLNYLDFKIKLSKEIEAQDCIILGSSSAIQVSLQNQNKILSSHCSSMVNLAIAGSGLEDIVIMLQSIMDSKVKHKTIFLALTINHLIPSYSDIWRRNEELYYKALDSIDLNYKHNSNRHNDLVNLINPEYFYRSLTKLWEGSPDIVNVQKFDHSKGIESPVMLPDGAIVYSGSFVSKSKNKKILIPKETKIDFKSYKGNDSGMKLGIVRVFPSGKFYSKKSVELLTKLLSYVKSNGVNVNILMLPIHHNIWKEPSSLIARSLTQGDSIIREIASDMEISVIGSYFPQDIRCKSDEFYDSHHAKPSCLAKIK